MSEEFREGVKSRTRNRDVLGDRDFRDERSGRQIREEFQFRPTERRQRIRVIAGNEWKRKSRSRDGSKAGTSGRDDCVRDGHSRRRNDIDKGNSRRP